MCSSRPSALPCSVSPSRSARERRESQSSKAKLLVRSGVSKQSFSVQCLPSLLSLPVDFGIPGGVTIRGPLTGVPSLPLSEKEMNFLPAHWIGRLSPHSLPHSFLSHISFTRLSSPTSASRMQTSVAYTHTHTDPVQVGQTSDPVVTRTENFTSA